MSEPSPKESLHRLQRDEDSEQLEPNGSPGAPVGSTAVKGDESVPITDIHSGLLKRLSKASATPSQPRRGSQPEPSYDVPDVYVNLDELAIPSPVQNLNEDRVYSHRTLEEIHNQEQEYNKELANKGNDASTNKKASDNDTANVSRLATQLYTISYLILFAILGTLARLGLQTITFYPGTPVLFSELWANFGGSLFFGFLSEDRRIFAEEWGVPKYQQVLEKAKAKSEDEESGSIDLPAAKKAHNATKKTIPLYIGLATGFCGSFTSFSSFMRDAFLALSNNLPTPLSHPSDYTLPSNAADSEVSRDGGYSFMALLAVIIVTITVCISALHIGAHIAILLENTLPSLSYAFGRRFIDRLAVFLAWGCWLGAVFLAIFPPDRNSDGSESWRGRAVFSIVFAPVGCLCRFYASLHLNGKIASFPLGTFFVNICGIAVLGMCWDLQHVPLGGVVGCQVLQGIEDGFCGCLTTVSTWVGELSSLRRSHSYRYGATSVVVGLCFLIVIMGSLGWTHGFDELQCIK